MAQLVAAVEFAALGLYYLGSQPRPITFFTCATPVVAKSVLMVVAGVACAFVGADSAAASACTRARP